METKNEIQKTDDRPQQIVQIDRDAPLMVQIVQMMQSGLKIDTEQMEKMIELSERVEANNARKDFAADFTVAQANIGAVVKGKYNPQTKSNYAGLDGIIDMCKPVYTERGFSVIFYEGKPEEPGNIGVFADVLHKSGHKETYHYDVPMGGTGIKGVVNMTKIHGKATSVSYGKRYLLCMIWNIPTQDNDGNQPPAPPKTLKVTDEQEAVMAAAIALIKPADIGFIVYRSRLRSLMLEKCRERLVPGQEGMLSAWLMKHEDRDLYRPDDRSEADRPQETYPDEQSQEPHGDAYEEDIPFGGQQ